MYILYEYVLCLCLCLLWRVRNKKIKEKDRKEINRVILVVPWHHSLSKDWRQASLIEHSAIKSTWIAGWSECLLLICALILGFWSPVFQLVMVRKCSDHYSRCYSRSRPRLPATFIPPVSGLLGALYSVQSMYIHEQWLSQKHLLIPQVLVVICYMFSSCPTQTHSSTVDSFLGQIAWIRATNFRNNAYYLILKQLKQ